MRLALCVLFALVVCSSSFGETKKVYVHESGSATEVQPTLMGGARARQTSFLNDVLHYWAKTKECVDVMPQMKEDGADFDAALASDQVGVMPRVAYTVTDKDGRLVTAKTVSPKNVAKDICKAVASR